MSHNSDVMSHNSDVMSHNSDVTSQNSDVTSQNSDVMSQNSDVTSHNSDVMSHNSDVSSHNSDVTSHNSDVMSHVLLTYRRALRRCQSVREWDEGMFYPPGCRRAVIFDDVRSGHEKTLSSVAYFICAVEKPFEVPSPHSH